MSSYMAGFLKKYFRRNPNLQLLIDLKLITKTIIQIVVIYTKNRIMAYNYSTIKKIEVQRNFNLNNRKQNTTTYKTKTEK